MQNEKDVSDDTENELGDYLPWLEDSGRSTSTELIELSLVSEKTDKAINLSIPKAYLTDVKNWKEGKQEVVKIETGSPELEPRPANF